ncbi:MAG: dimethylarginine dimethylaminohydrolase, partial [Pseudomonadota bacterium]|nr:dimethylarginine dimethylaminohydrolase [Pseudomonadota bacterium]
MIGDAAFRFSHALARRPSPVVVNGLRAGAGPDPDFAVFSAQHDAYRKALSDAGVAVTTLPADNAHPDAVFVEDAALMIAGQAIILKPGAVSRRGEAAR